MYPKMNIIECHETTMLPYKGRDADTSRGTVPISTAFVLISRASHLHFTVSERTRPCPRLLNKRTHTKLSGVDVWPIFF